MRVDPVGVTDGDGRVVLDVGSADLNVWVLHPDFLAYGDPPALGPPDGRTFVPTGPGGRRAAREGDTTRIVRSRGIVVRGSVFDPRPGPVVGAWVQAAADDGRGSAHAVPDDRGRYELTPVRPERTPWVVATRSDPPGAGRRRLAFVPRMGTVAAFDLVVAPPSRLRGTVREVGGGPVAGARVAPFPIVELEDLGGSEVRRFVAADEFSRFVARNVPPGTYRVRASARGLEGDARDPVVVSSSPGVALKVALKVAPVIVRPRDGRHGVRGGGGRGRAGARGARDPRQPSVGREVLSRPRVAFGDGDGRARGGGSVSTAGTPETLEVVADDPDDGRRTRRARENVGPRTHTDLPIEVR